MSEAEVLDKLSNMNLNIDSATAVQIAEQYIQFKYVDMGLGFVCVMALLIGAGFVIKKIMEDM